MQAARPSQLRCVLRANGQLLLPPVASCYKPQYCTDFHKEALWGTTATARLLAKARENLTTFKRRGMSIGHRPLLPGADTVLQDSHCKYLHHSSATSGSQNTAEDRYMAAVLLNGVPPQCSWSGLLTKPCS